MGKIRTNDTVPDEISIFVATSQPAIHTDAVSPQTGGRFRCYLAMGWHFTRHLLEMVVAMMAGMAVLSVALVMLSEPSWYANPLVEYGVMGAFMSASMGAWMRYRGHSWSDGLEMTAAMLVPMFVLVFLEELGVAPFVPGLSEQSLPVLSHVAMIAGMAVLMIYRQDRYAHGTHHRL